MGGKGSKLKKLEAEWEQLEEYFQKEKHRKQYPRGETIIGYVKNGHNINQLYNDKSTTLHFAASLKCENVVEYLLKNGADVTLKDKEKNLPLLYSLGNINITKQLTDHIEKLIEERKKEIDKKMKTNFEEYLPYYYDVSQMYSVQFMETNKDQELREFLRHVSKHLENMRNIIGIEKIRSYNESVNKGTRYKIKF